MHFFFCLQLSPPADKSLIYETSDEESNIKGSRKLQHVITLRCIMDPRVVLVNQDQPLCRKFHLSHYHFAVAHVYPSSSSSVSQSFISQSWLTRYGSTPRSILTTTIDAVIGEDERVFSANSGSFMVELLYWFACMHLQRQIGRDPLLLRTRL